MLGGAIALTVRALRDAQTAKPAEAPTVTEVLPQDSGELGAIMPHITISSAQTIGRRENQEDALCSSDPNRFPADGCLLAAVADGIGGLDDGQVASGTAMRNMLERFRHQKGSQEPAARLLTLAAEANNDVVTLNRTGRKIGCTLIAALIQSWQLYFASIGDSRICLYRHGGLIQLNRPHVFGKEQEELMALKRIPSQPIDARRAKALTCYAGREDLQQIDRNVEGLTLLRGDRLLLMSDGVFGTLTEQQLTSILARESATPAEAIIAAVNAAGRSSQDNATALVVTIA